MLLLLILLLTPQQPLAFDVASVRPANPNDQPTSNVPLGPGNLSGNSHGVLIAKGFTLFTYLSFAYKLTDYQESALRSKAPTWITQTYFNIEARTDNREATKDDLRLMMRALLADRFHLTTHYETREVPVYALVKPGTLGPKLQPHPATASCETYTPNRKSPEGTPIPDPPEKGDTGYPTYCGGILGLTSPAPDRYSFGARNVTMPQIAASLSSWGNLGRPVLDRTTLPGTYDFVLDFTPDRPVPNTQDSGGPTFQQALTQQLGLKLTPTRGPVDFLVLDHADPPTPN